MCGQAKCPPQELEWFFLFLQTLYLLAFLFDTGVTPLPLYWSERLDFFQRYPPYLPFCIGVGLLIFTVAQGFALKYNWCVMRLFGLAMGAIIWITILGVYWNIYTWGCCTALGLWLGHILCGMRLSAHKMSNQHRDPLHATITSSSP